MKITKINEYIGAEVTGVNLNKPISEAIKIEIYNALIDNVALIIRDQNFSAEEFMQAVSLFGELMEDQNRRYLADDVPMVSVLSNRHVDSTGKPAKIANNATWHTDHTNQEYPPKFTILYPVELPDAGGGTAQGDGGRIRDGGGLPSPGRLREEPREPSLQPHGLGFAAVLLPADVR